ncbi:hypothetical protein [Cyanobium sp. A2C-AMD]|uniref:hypothetical protein n=1 Tax=Cyanobium sp. A2C-AMD TaxID=2823695 RepID=UPI0020CCBAF7|nr:hypothetical protein [Cyanobium sp. A2C-AMD]MCP9878152.1 hypothetical protein [Cyanobium sp. A2C-AMD]
MNKKNADKVKRKFSIEHQYQEALEHLTREQLDSALKTLNTIQAALEEQISDYAIDLIHDLLDDETPQIVRTFWFSKGMTDYYFCIDGTGMIRAMEQAMPYHLLDQIMGALDSIDERGDCS